MTNSFNRDDGRRRIGATHAVAATYRRIRGEAIEPEYPALSLVVVNGPDRSRLDLLDSFEELEKSYGPIDNAGIACRGIG